VSLLVEKWCYRTPFLYRFVRFILPIPGQYVSKKVTVFNESLYFFAVFTQICFISDFAPAFLTFSCIPSGK